MVMYNFATQPPDSDAYARSINFESGGDRLIQKFWTSITENPTPGGGGWYSIVCSLPTIYIVFSYIKEKCLLLEKVWGSPPPPRCYVPELILFFHYLNPIRNLLSLPSIFHIFLATSVSDTKNVHFCLVCYHTMSRYRIFQKLLHTRSVLDSISARCTTRPCLEQKPRLGRYPCVKIVLHIRTQEKYTQGKSITISLLFI